MIHISLALYLKSLKWSFSLPNSSTASWRKFWITAASNSDRYCTSIMQKKSQKKKDSILADYVSRQVKGRQFGMTFCVSWQGFFGTSAKGGTMAYRWSPKNYLQWEGEVAALNIQPWKLNCMWYLEDKNLTSSAWSWNKRQTKMNFLYLVVTET